MRPVVLVPSYPRIPQGRIKGWNEENVGVPAPYLDALRRSGAIESIVMTEELDSDAIDRLLGVVDALLLLGGGDLDPSTYAAKRTTDRIYGVSAHRDTTELDLVRAAVHRGMPTLGICRGHQILNVALGGTLDQHIPDREGVTEHGRPGEDDAGLEHEIDVVAGTRLARAAASTRVTATCHHHQAVDTPGAGLRVTARAADGIIEGTELADAAGPWIVSVQWHPEDTAAKDPAQQGLFDALVGAAGG
jgi:putative glutamine amidotransferase